MEPEEAEKWKSLNQEEIYDVADRHYKLAGSAKATRRFAERGSGLQDEAAPRDDYWKTN
ncbi:hypothetical protein [Rhizobium sp. EC-SD404]|uniref:hypothetical protein n=1 Tax=Rhizobium sp. EC-SD404 TaxID=2038389 RepID=UPI001258B833|nr:hypothetical protein [Rhizobium sp. EC-SD404]VVS96159.1 hypothetical protein RHIZ404_120003 [Rhizobium sp. EC-SD404]